jgi:hypothetical protein
MPARVVVVLRERVLASKTAETLISTGYNATVLTNARVALQALEAAKNIELLITSQPNELALARMTRQPRPDLKVIFANGPETEPHIRHDGAFIPTPTTPGFIVEVADKLMKAAA